LAHPERWECKGGEIVPWVSTVEGVPGRGGNGPGDFQASGAVAQQERIGWRRIPEDLVFRAFGVERRIESCPAGSTYLDWYRSTSPSGWYLPAWSRVRPTFDGPRFTHDIEGEMSFRRAVGEWLLSGRKPSDDAIQAAIREPIETARSYADRADSPTISARLHEILAAIPRDLVPSDLRRFLPAEES
jgi:hypothetical protein